MFVAFAAAAVVLVAALAFSRLTSHLPPGRRAPEFRVHGALGGAVREFSLREALAAGPVVLCFFPKSFTKGCTIEMRAFAERIGEFEAAGATVLGVSGDDLETQRRFSATECAGKVMIASDPGFIAKRYRVALAGGASNRTSYVIAPDGTIAESFSSMFEPRKHVDATLKAVRSLASARPAPAGTAAPALRAEASADGAGAQRAEDAASGEGSALRANR